MISSFVRALISAFKARRELVPADELNRRHRSEASPAARNTLDSARIPRASKLLICGLFQKGRVLAQDGIGVLMTEDFSFHC